jgi:hypothetical protein
MRWMGEWGGGGVGMVRRLSICMYEGEGKGRREACLKCHGRQARHDSCRRELEESTDL